MSLRNIKWPVVGPLATGILGLIVSAAYIFRHEYWFAGSWVMIAAFWIYRGLTFRPGTSKIPGLFQNSPSNLPK